MEKINISELNSTNDVDRFPKGTIFIMDSSEKQMLTPDCLRTGKNDKEIPSDRK